MAKIVDVMPDPFIGQGTDLADYIPQYRDTRTDADKVRHKEEDASERAKKNWEYSGQIRTVSRPVGGITIKPNTYAFVQVIDKAGKVIRVLNKLGVPAAAHNFGSMQGRTYEVSGLKSGSMDSPWLPSHKDVNPSGWTTDPEATDSTHTMAVQSGMSESGRPISYVWTDWLLQSVKEDRAEKTQLVDTFGDSYLFVFGQKPRAMTFTGILMNTESHQWKAAFWENWDRFFRATKLVEKDARMYISYDDVLVEGYPINATASQSSHSPNAITFQFNFFVTRYINIAARTWSKKSRKQYSLAQVESGYDQSGFEWKDNRYLPFALHNLFGRSPTGRSASSAFGSIAEKAGEKAFGGDSPTGRLWARFARDSLNKIFSSATQMAWIGMGNYTGYVNKDYLNQRVMANLAQHVGTGAMRAAFESLEIAWAASDVPFASKGFYGGSSLNQIFGAATAIARNTMNANANDGFAVDPSGDTDWENIWLQGSMYAVIDQMGIAIYQDFMDGKTRTGTNKAGKTEEQQYKEDHPVISADAIAVTPDPPQQGDS